MLPRRSSMCWGAIDCQWLWFIYVHALTSECMLFAEQFILADILQSSTLLFMQIHYQMHSKAPEGVQTNMPLDLFAWCLGVAAWYECSLLLHSDGSRFRVKWIQRHNKQMKDASSLRGSGVDFKGFVRQIRLHAHETSTNHGKVQWIHHFVTNGRSQKPESE